MKERLEAAKQGSTRGLGAPTTSIGGVGGAFAWGAGVGSRIAKPLRGGGEALASIPTIAGLKENDGPGASGNKRSSWFFSGQK